VTRHICADMAAGVTLCPETTELPQGSRADPHISAGEDRPESSGDRGTEESPFFCERAGMIVRVRERFAIVRFAQIRDMTKGPGYTIHDAIWSLTSTMEKEVINLGLWRERAKKAGSHAHLER
jgi:hypothetical protein